jgi:hypothetical protein
VGLRGETKGRRARLTPVTMEWLTPLLFVGGWLVLQLWLLPRLGVPT